MWIILISMCILISYLKKKKQDRKLISDGTMKNMKKKNYFDIHVLVFFFFLIYLLIFDGETKTTCNVFC